MSHLHLDNRLGCQVETRREILGGPSIFVAAFGECIVVVDRGSRFAGDPGDKTQLVRAIGRIVSNHQVPEPGAVSLGFGTEALASDCQARSPLPDKAGYGEHQRGSGRPRLYPIGDRGSAHESGALFRPHRLSMSRRVAAARTVVAPNDASGFGGVS